MVLVEDLGGLPDVEPVVGRDVPRQRDEPVHVGPDDADLGRGGRDPAHPVDLLDRPGADLLRHAGGLDLLAELVDLGLLRVVLAQLALDRLELLAEDVLPLGLVHLGLDLALDLPLELEDLDLAGEERADELEPLLDVDRLEQLLALLGRHVGAVRHHVGEEAGLGDVARGDGRLGRDRGAVRDVLLDLRLHAPDERLDLDALGRLVGELLDARGEVRRRLAEAVDADAGLALDDRPDGAVLELHDLGDLGERADLVQLGRVADVLLLSLALGHEGDRAAGFDRGVERSDALLAADLEGDDHLREDDGLPERDERELAHLGGGGLGLGLGRRGRRSLGHYLVSLGAGSWVGDAVRMRGVRWVGFAITWAPNRRRGRDPQSRWPPSRPTRRRPPRRPAHGFLRRTGPRGSACRGAPRARTGSGPRRG